MYDAIVVGAGPAGLLAAVYLARFRRSVAVIDAGQSRVALIPRSHNYPGFGDGVSGLTVLDMLRAQLGHYAVDRLGTFVEGAEWREDGFHLQTRTGALAARQLLLATGVTDIPPAMPHVREALEAGVLRYCPVCDAYEVIDKAVGVYADGEAGVGEALYLRHFSADITLFMAPGGQVLTEAQRRRLAEAGIRWNEAPVHAVRREGVRVAVVHEGGTAWCDTLYCALGVAVHSQIAQGLGATLDGTGYVQVDAHHATDVPGLYAAGDVSSGLNQIAVALGGAAIAASAMHRALPMGTPGTPIASR